jgi:hypothetical protein
VKHVLLLLVIAGCEPALDQRLDVVTEPRVLAIVSEPPEVLPGATVAVTALIADPTGTLAEAPAWSLCDAPKPPTEDNAVADGCVQDEVTPIADPAMTAIPMDACETYGPDVETAGFRPRDPDSTGGYYQPVRAQLPDVDLAFGFTRITCDLANAPGDLSHQYQIEYVANANPILEPPVLDVDPTAIAAGADVAITASWPSVESYLYYDPVTETLVTRRESMRLSWFTTAGEFPVDASAVDEADPAQSVTTTWHAPATPGTAWLWLVLRDSRGGLATQTLEVTVQ